jgi:hypothetical protein
MEQQRVVVEEHIVDAARNDAIDDVIHVAKI